MVSRNRERNSERFELIIGDGAPAGYPVMVTQSPAGETKATCQLAADDPDLQSVLGEIAAGQADRTLLIDLGNFLFDSLFTGDVATLYRTSLSMARAQRQSLRVRLRIEAPELASLPWEYLYDRQEEQFLAMASEISLVRHVPLRLPVRPSAVTLPLRLLVAFSSPRHLPPIDIHQERQLIQAALQTWTAEGKIQLHFVERATVPALNQALLTVQPHIFHFVGHGIFVEDKGSVILEDEDGEAQSVDELIFRELFAASQETRLAVLNACQTASLSSSQPLIGLGPRLLQRRLSAVVAMQYAISDRVALLFVRYFYQSLVLGLSVDAALSETRRSIYLETDGASHQWGAPVLFLRAQDSHLFQLQAPSDEPAHVAVPPPPTPLPILDRFIGRDDEITFYREGLERTGLALITGMAGLGKTTLAAELLRRAKAGERSFWHTFQATEGIESLIWKLAGFQARHGRADLWRMLQTTAQNGGQPPPPSLLIDYVFEGLRGLDLWICLDDFHLVENDPFASQLLARLHTAVLAGDIRLIVTSRHLVRIDREIVFPPLKGLLLADVRQILLDKGIHLPDNALDILYQSTEGNAELLTLAAAAFHAESDVSHVLQRLVQSQNVEHYLLTEIDNYLDDEQKSVMSGVAALLGYPGTRDAVEEVLDGFNARRTLAYLCNRHLLFAQDGAVEREYGAHAIVQAFYYNLLSRRQRMTMHSRAALYYEFEEVDDLRASLHAVYAGDEVRAVRLATRDLESHINQGRAQALAKLLSQISADKLSTSERNQLLEARGDLHYFMAELDEAIHFYRAAVEPAAMLSPADEARILRKIGDVLSRQGDYQQALVLLDQAYQHTKTVEVPMPEKGCLALSRGTVLLNLGRHDEAQAAGTPILAEIDQALYPRIAADAIDLLGKIDFFRGDVPSAIQKFNNALEIRRKYDDPRDLVRSHSNLAVAYGEQNHLAEAIKANLSALEIAQRIGDAVAAAQIESNLGGDYAEQGEYTESLHFLARALDRYTQMGSLPGLRRVHNNLSHIHLRLHQIEVAEHHAQLAVQFAQQMKDPWAEIVSSVTLGEVQLAQDRPVQALTTALNAQRLAQEMEIDGSADLYQLLAEAHRAQAQIPEARDAYRHAALHWEEEQSWADLARTYQRWIEMERQTGHESEAARLTNMLNALRHEHDLPSVH